MLLFCGNAPTYINRHLVLDMAARNHYCKGMLLQDQTQRVNKQT